MAVSFWTEWSSRFLLESRNGSTSVYFLLTVVLVLESDLHRSLATRRWLLLLPLGRRARRPLSTRRRPRRPGLRLRGLIIRPGVAEEVVRLLCVPLRVHVRQLLQLLPPRGVQVLDAPAQHPALPGALGRGGLGHGLQDLAVARGARRRRRRRAGEGRRLEGPRRGRGRLRLRRGGRLRRLRLLDLELGGGGVVREAKAEKKKRSCNSFTDFDALLTRMALRRLARVAVPWPRPRWRRRTGAGGPGHSRAGDDLSAVWP